MSEKGMTTLCETAESESVRLRARPAVLPDQIAIAIHANRVTSSDASSNGTGIGFPADFDAEMVSGHQDGVVAPNVTPIPERLGRHDAIFHS